MADALSLGLHAAVVAVDTGTPLVLTVPGQLPDGTVRPGLPFGPFQPATHRTLEMGLRQWVETQTELQLGYVEQLYTFGDFGRFRQAEPKKQTADGAGSSSLSAQHFVSVGYLALVRTPSDDPAQSVLRWKNWYQFFPWEDWRNGQPVILDDIILPALAGWVQAQPDKVSSSKGLNRVARFRLAFGCDGPGMAGERDRLPTITSWDEERVLERYELMYEAGLVAEAITDGRVVPSDTSARPIALPQTPLGEAMLYDHRRILATAIARLRGKLKYRPVVFELLPDAFTLTQLQQTVETLSGRSVHKQNFRRMVEKADLVEPTGTTAAQTGGRPAAYFRFRRSVTLERPRPGLRIAPRV
ncbi:MAG: NAD regulator [Pseudomonadota bacterium]